ncbi:MAG TPA: patatin-like phospholipase family protein [Vicinamibacterales bacterium]|nr:patatin-like phospholipase family protein [Vicinamibacterales bacterium]
MIVELLRARAARASRAPHGDGASIALCVEGGAMRGVVSAGMVSALEDLGLVRAFDAVYGSSAGAINAAYFLAGQAAFGTAIYAEDINNRHFIDLRRILTGGPVVDLGFLLDDVAVKRKPLDTARVLGSPSPLTVMATDVATASRAALRGFRDAPALFTALRAGATMPVLAGPPVTHEGRQYLDASLTEPIPVSVAEADGHTHILALLTRPGASPRATTAFDRWYVLPRLRRLSPALADLYAGRGEPYAGLLSAIDRGRGPLGRSSVLGLRPAPPVVSKLERSSDVLRRAARGGFDAVMQAFGK